jgi:hypothetical protein
MIEFKEIEDEIEWERFIESSDKATLFHTSNWFKLLLEVYGVYVHRLGIFDNDKLIGIFPILIRKRGPFRLAGSPLSGMATPCLGPIIDQPLLPDILDEFDRFQKKEKIDYVDIMFPYLVQENILKERGYVVEERKTFILDLTQNIDQLWVGFEVRCRNAIRKSQKAKVEVIEADTPEFLKEYYNMAIDVYKRQNRPPAIPFKFFQTLWNILKPQNRLKVLFARYEGKLIAGAIFPHFKDTIYYTDGVSYREYNKVAPNNLIQWELIKWAVENKFKRYDMVGANIPSIAKFKASFGGMILPYTYTYRANSVFAYVSRILYKRIMPIIRKIRMRK